MANIKVPADIIMVRLDGTVIEIHIRNKPPANEYNKQAEIFKQTTQTCHHCKAVGRIWGGRCLACGEWYD